MSEIFDMTERWVCPKSGSDIVLPENQACQWPKSDSMHRRTSYKAFDRSKCRNTLDSPPFIEGQDHQMAIPVPASVFLTHASLVMLSFRSQY
jgi:hypothetical protein